MFKIGDAVHFRNRRDDRYLVASEPFTNVVVDDDDRAANARGLDCCTVITAYELLHPETGRRTVASSDSLVRAYNDEEDQPEEA